MIFYSRILVKYILMLLYVLLLICGCSSQNNEAESSDDQKLNFEEYCRTHECRKDLKFNLKTPDDNYFKFSATLSEPVVQESVDKSDSSGKKKNYLVTVYPGETVNIAFDQGDKGPENLHSVSDTGGSENILTLKLSQEQDIANGCGMKLYINNSSRFFIKNWLFIQKIEDAKSSKVSSCPLKPESSRFETWQFPVFKIHMGKFEWADEDDLECK